MPTARSAKLALSTALAFGLLAGAAEGSPLSPQQAESAITAAVKAMGRQATVKVYDVLGCLPAFNKPKGTWICRIDHLHPGRGTREQRNYVFRQKGNDWTIHPEEMALNAACPPNGFAQTAFRTMRNDNGLRVLSEVDKGEGSFTDSRGMSRDKKGPMRLMCRYEVKTGSGRDLLFITYVWHDGRTYSIDPDIEIWN